MPASASASMSSKATYFVAATIVTSGPTSPRIRSRFARTASGDTGDHTLDAARLARAAMREEAVGVAVGAEVDAVDVFDAGHPKRLLGRGPQVELASVEERPAVGGRKPL